MTIATFRAEIAEKAPHLATANDAVFFPAGRYDGRWEVEWVEKLLHTHGCERVLRIESGKIHASEFPKSRKEGEFCLWDAFVLRFREAREAAP